MDEQRAWIKSRRKKRLRFLAVVMCASLLFTSYPEILENLSVLAATERQGSGESLYIYGFEELPEEIREQYVPVGTAQEGLTLPDVLEASVGEADSNALDDADSGADDEKTEDSESEDGKGEGDADTEEDSGEGNIDTEESESGEDHTDTEREEGQDAQSEETVEGDIDAAEADMEEADIIQETYTVTMPEYQAENVISIETLENTAETAVTINGVTWQSNPAYDGNTEETYIFTAILPDGYTLAEGVSLPQITVTVQENGIDAFVQALLDRIAVLPDAGQYLLEEPEAEDEEAYAEWEVKFYEYAEEALAIWKKYKTLTEDQQTQIPEEELEKLTAWVELAEQLARNDAVMLADSEHHAGWTALTNQNTVLNGGNYYLTGNITMDTITTTGEVTLCLNGHTLTHSGDTGSVIKVESGTFTLCDCSGGSGCITGGKGTVYNSVAFGGGVCVADGATFNMEGGTISGNTASNGGGVSVGIKPTEGSVLATFNMSGGIIKDNKADLGGGIFCQIDSKVTISDADISGNVSSGRGGGIATGSIDIVVRLSNVNITGNTSNGYGGGYFMAAGQGNNGAVPGELHLSGHINISGNTNSGVTNNLFLMNRKVVTIDDGLTGSIGVMTQWKPNAGKDDPNTPFITIAQGGNGHAVSAQDFSCFSSDDGAYSVFMVDDKAESSRGKVFVLGTEGTGNLSGMELSIKDGSSGEEIKLSPEFAETTYKYAVTVPNSVKAVAIEATPKNTDAGVAMTIQNSGNATDTSVAADNIPLAVGKNTVRITVNEGNATKIYTIIITREESKGNPVTITAYKDGAAWTGKSPDFKLSSDNGTTFIEDLTAVSDGTYHIYDGDTDTKVTVAVHGAEATARVDYYTVTFYDKDTALTAPAQQTVISGLPASAPADVPTKDGYTFSQWVTAYGGSTAYDFTTAVTEKTSVYAGWTPITYTITYNLDGGTATGNPTTYTIESSAITLKKPEKVGYTFTGWSGTGLTEENNLTVTIPAGSTGNREYTAHWEAKQYTVTLNGNGGNGTALTGYSYGTGAALPTGWTKTGYTFAGWYNNEDCSGTAVTEISATDTENKEYWAKWTPVTYTITYVLDGGTVTGNPKNYTIESGMITLKNPTREGYSFAGWSGTDLTDNNNMTVTIPAGSTGNREYTAHWEAKQYTVTLNGNGGNGTDLTGYSYGTGAALPTGWTKTGYTFTGWYDNADCTGTAVTEISATDTENKEYWAKWTPVTYTITYVLDGGTVTGNPTTYTIESSTITLKEPEKEGYSFAGWSSTDLTGNNNMSVTIPAGSTGNRTYTAHWTAADYIVTLHTNGGSGGTGLTSYVYGTGAVLPTDWVKTGYTFAGWYDNKNCTGTAVTAITATDIGNKEYWAEWTANIYQLNFDYHGADSGNTDTSKSVTFGSAYGTLPQPGRTGYVFKGWYTEADGAGSRVEAETIMEQIAVHTLHAYWKDETAPDKPVLQDNVTLPADWTATQTTIPLKLHDGVGVTELWVSIDGGAYGKINGFTGGTGTVEYAYPVTEGVHTYQFQAKDAAENPSAASDVFTVKLDTAKPVIGTITYEKKTANLWNWIIGKKSLVIHVPVTETGSGVAEISYTMTPRDTAGNAENSNAVTKTASIEGEEAKITFDADFRGTITISCTDGVGNAASMTIGADGGGVIVEDRAPGITTDVSADYYDTATDISVTVKDDDSNAITAGIATVTYQVADGAEKSVAIDTGALQAEKTFTIPAAEIPTGITEIKIHATDNAGNENTEIITVKVKGPEKEPAAGIDFHEEKLTGLVPGGEYTIDGAKITADGAGCVPIDGSWFDKTIRIIKKGNDSETIDSTAQNLSIPARPAAPNAPELSSRTDSSITVKTIAAAQYRIGNGGWQDDMAFAGLSEKTVYSFRAYYPATDTSFASPESGVSQIATMPKPPTADKLVINYAAETFALTDGIEAFSDAGCTAPVTAGSAEDYIGVTVYIRYPANGIIPASAVTPVSIPARAQKPTPGKADTSYPGASDGKITGLTADGSYMLSADGGSTWESRAANENGEITGLNAGTYELYVAAGGMNFRSETASVTVGETPAAKQDTPAIRINYENRTLTGFVPGEKYTINGAGLTADQNGTIQIKTEWFATTLSITRNGNNRDKLDSDPQSLSIPAIPPKPTPAGVDASTAGGTGKLTGLTAGTTYEISADGGRTWETKNADGSGAVTGLAPGTYTVRVKAGTSNFASEPSEPATIGTYKVTVTFMADGKVYKEISVGYGTTLTEIPSVPSKDGRTGDWYVDEQGSRLAEFTNITADMTVYAVYTTVYTVTLGSGEGYTLSSANGSVSPVKEGGSYTFRFELKAGYHRVDGSFAVMVNDVKVELTANDTYMITDIRSNQTVRAEGVAKDADKPSGGENNDPDKEDEDNSQPTPPPTDTPQPPSPTNPPEQPQPPSPTNPPEQPQPTEVPDDKPGTEPGTPDNSQPEEDKKPESTETPQPAEQPAETEKAPEGDSGQTISVSIDGGTIIVSDEPVKTGNVNDMTSTSNTLQLGNGAVIVTVVCEEEAYTAGVADTVAVANAVLLPEQIEQVNSGETIEIRIDVTDISGRVPEQDKEVIEKGFEEYRREVPGLTLGMYVDLSMFIKIGESDWDAITETGEPIEVIIGIPEELQEAGRTYYIIRSHEGEYTFMDDMDDEQDTITISTDRFSSYAIAYEKADNTADRNRKCSLCHICPTFLGICYFIWLAVIIVAVLVILFVIRKKRKEQKEQE